ncbi:MAG: nuclear transport factor 2 family protein [Candidatus Acidiferrum sp.]
MKSPRAFASQSHLAPRPAFRFACITFLVAALLSITASLTAQEHDDTGAAAARVMSLETLWNQAQVDRDVHALGQLVPETFFYVDTTGNLKTQSEFLDNVKNGPDHPTELKNEMLVAHAYSNTVVVTGVYRRKGTAAGKRVSEHGRFTDTWVQTNGAWLCVARQSTLTEK